MSRMPKKDVMKSVGMRNSLRALLETERQYQTNPPQFFAVVFIYSFVQSGVKDPKDLDQLFGYLNRAKEKGYVEGRQGYVKVGAHSEAAISVYRTKQEKKSEIERLLASE